MFYCHGCGLCCRHMDELLDVTGKPPSLVEMIEAFPYGHEGGVCEQLGADGSCGVYDQRPDLCNRLVFREKVMPLIPLRHFDILLETQCKKLMLDSGDYTMDDINEIYSLPWHREG